MSAENKDNALKTIAITVISALLITLGTYLFNKYFSPSTTTPTTVPTIQSEATQAEQGRG